MTTDYPAVGSVAVLESGTRVMVWPNESDDAECFTGQEMVDGLSACNAMHGCSCMWLRAAIVRVEAPTGDQVRA